jgi:hypothetical protein
MRLDAIEDTAGEPRRRHRSRGDHPHVGCEDRPAPVLDGAIGEKPLDAAREPRENIAKAFEGLLAGALGRHIARAEGDRAMQGRVDHQPPVDHVG